MKDLPVRVLVEHADTGQLLALIAWINGDRSEVVVDFALGELVLVNDTWKS
jgi:hypothetical protein